MRLTNVADAALKARQYPDVDAAFAIQQIEGWQKAQQKLPEMAKTDGWIWPKRVSMEQCSSEETARYKCRLIRGISGTGADLTGGFGVDSYYLSEPFERWHYVEQQEELCRIAEHNFALAGRQQVTVHHDSAEQFIAGIDKVDLIYLDPARRDSHGGKVFRLEDCTPDLSVLYPTLISRCNTLMIKLSPMLDLQEAVRHLPALKTLHIVAVRGEVKELLAVCEAGYEEACSICAVNLCEGREEKLVFTPQEEAEALVEPALTIAAGDYLYEPNAAVLKAGAFRLAGARFGLRKAAPSTHLYVASEKVDAFPGRIFRVTEIVEKQGMKALAGKQANILCRNYPLRPDELKKKLKTRDGGERYIIGFRLGDKPIIITAERLQ